MGDIAKRSQSQKDVLDKIRKGVQSGASAPGSVVPGSVGLDFRCSTTKKGYRVLLRKGTDGRYEVGGVQTGECDAKQEPSGSSSADALNINVNDINLYSIRCPHCQGGKWPFVKCGCGGLSCSGGAKTVQDRHEFVCPWCGYAGYLQGTIDSVTGRATRKGQTPQSQPGVKFLPSSSADRMLDKGKR